MRLRYVARAALRWILTLTTLAAVHAGVARGAELESRGFLGTETRVFLPDDIEATEEAGIAAAGRLQVDAEAERVSTRLRVFTRHDGLDRLRSVLVAEEAWAEARLGRVRLRLGVDMVTWTALEAFHPADVFNSRNFDSNPESFEKLGEPMAQLRVRLFQGDVAVYALPVHGGSRPPSVRSRLSLGPPGLPLGEAMYLDRGGALTDDRLGMQWAARFTQTLGDADIGVHVLQHLDRLHPLVIADPLTGQVRPLYQYATEVAGTYAHVLGPVMVKVEAVHRRYRDAEGDNPGGPLPERDHTIVAAGLEYTFTHQSGADSTWLTEGQVLFGPEKEQRRQLELFQNDVFVGYRLSANDESSRTALVGVLVDVERPQEFLVSASMSQRLGETWGLSAGLRILRVPPKVPGAPVGFERWNGAHQLFLNLNRYF